MQQIARYIFISWSVGLLFSIIGDYKCRYRQYVWLLVVSINRVMQIGM
jgi:hypothetical protein